jgi:3-phenylpropionate/trans-cinnamate dioxygenase ferredoxin component
LKAVEASRVPEGSMVSVEAGGEQVLVANVGGEYLCIGAICSHEQWDLSEGKLSGGKVTCAGHGSVWDLRTGKAVFDEPLEDEPVYDAKVDGEFIWIRKK